MGSIDIVIFNTKKGAITDWLELQSSGAIGVIFEEYEEPVPSHVDALNDRCDDYNALIGVTFEESESEDDSDSESESDEEENESTK